MASVWSADQRRAAARIFAHALLPVKTKDSINREVITQVVVEEPELSEWDGSEDEEESIYTDQYESSEEEVLPFVVRYCLMGFCMSVV